MPHFKLQTFPFTDHNVCGMKTILNFCIDAHLFLSKHDYYGTLFGSGVNIVGPSQNQNDNKNAAIAVHCKAGKGRTGLMVICFLIFSEHEFEKKEAPKNAIDYYNVKRTMNKKGLTIAS